MGVREGKNNGRQAFKFLLVSVAKKRKEFLKKY